MNAWFVVTLTWVLSWWPVVVGFSYLEGHGLMLGLIVRALYQIDNSIRTRASVR